MRGMKRAKRLLALLLVFALAGCSAPEIDDPWASTPPTLSPAPPSSVPEIDDPWGVSLTVSDVTATGCTYTFTQRGGNPGKDLGYGSKYHLERKDGGDWAEVEELSLPDGVMRGWTLVLYLIPLGESVSEEVKWDGLYGELPAGDYRLCKEVDQGEPGAREERMYYAEFTIE